MNDGCNSSAQNNHDLWTTMCMLTVADPRSGRVLFGFF